MRQPKERFVFLLWSTPAAIPRRFNASWQAALAKSLDVAQRIHPSDLEPPSGFEPLTVRLQGGSSAN